MACSNLNALRKTGAAALACSLLFAARGETTGACPYVRAGLAAFYDGIENAGAGKHDATATKWADLTGHGYDGALDTNVVWAADGWTNAADGRPVTLPPAVSDLLAAKRSFTVDFACRPASQCRRAAYFSQWAGTPAANGFALELNSSAHRKCGGFRAYQQGGIDHYSYNAYALADEEVTLAAAVAPGGVAMFKNGLTCDTFANVPKMKAVRTDAPFVIGGEPKRAEMAFRGTFHAFRLYARALTEAELMINAAVDALRYRGVPFEDIRLPEGASFDEGKNILLSVAVVAKGRGKVRVDDAAATQTHRATKRLNDTLTLTAVPSSASETFARWEGDVDLITSGSASAASIAVSVARPLRMIAVFEKSAVAGNPRDVDFTPASAARMAALAPFAGKKLAVIGDSYVQNHTRPISETWHYRLAEKFGMHYCNFGRNGNCVAFDRGARSGTPLGKRYDAIPSDADYIVVIAGHNDANAIWNCNAAAKIERPTDEQKAKQRELLGVFRSRLRKLLADLKARHPKATIVWVTPWNVQRPFFPEVISAIKAETAAAGVVCYDAASRTGIDPNSEDFRAKYFQSRGDTAHLNTAGHALMLAKMEAFFRSHEKRAQQSKGN